LGISILEEMLCSMNNISGDILMAIGGGSMSMNISSKTTLQAWHSGLAVFMDGREKY
jgi:hypothetical protein